MSNDPAPSPFVGRDAELARLRAAWDQVTAGEPRFLVWTADTGLGKTRLVQAFYEWLSTQRDARDPDGYWPDALSVSGRTLEVNPEFTPTDGPRPDIPWLWWGLRFTDSKYERGIAASTCGLVNAKGHLQPHLEPLVRARHGRALTTDAARTTAGIWANLFSAGIFGAVLDGFSVFELERERRRLDAPLTGIGEQQSRERRDAVEDLLALFRDLLGGGIACAPEDDARPRKRPIPCALILDDAQWADPDTLRFLETLYREALQKHWPLLVLCTHWQKEWNLHKQQAGTPNPNPEPRSIADLCQRIAAPRGGRGAGCCEVIPLPRLPDPDLRPVLAAALPGVTFDQAGALLARVGGNPGFLVDLIAYARTTPDTFEQDDPSAALTLEGFQDLLETSALDQRNLIEKRFRELDKDLQQTLALASYQGARFLEELLLEAARRLEDARCSGDQLRRAHDPHAVIERVTTDPTPPASEFRHRSWYEVANDYLGKRQQRARSRAFADQLRAVLTDWRGTGRLAELDPRDQILALNLLAGELRRALDIGASVADAQTPHLLRATRADLVRLHQAAGDTRQAATAAGELLQGTWDRVQAGQPQLLVLKGEPGLGKTRLVQAIYEWLSTAQDARDPDGYWPDRMSISRRPLDTSHRLLDVNPELSETDGPPARIPWLWWGLKFFDNRYLRGFATPCALVDAMAYLQPHLEPVVRVRHGRELTTGAAKTTVRICASLGIVGTALDALGVGDVSRQPATLGSRLPSIGEQRSSTRLDVVDKLRALFRDVLWCGGASARDMSKKDSIPCILVLDDAQWADVDTLRFVESLCYDALRDRSPLLVLCTLWQREWDLQQQQARTPNPDPAPRSIADLCQRISALPGRGATDCCEVITLHPLPHQNLRPVLAAALPGVSEAHADVLLARIGGNPSFLMDLIAYARSKPWLFERKDTSAALTPKGLRELVETTDLDHLHLSEKRSRELDGKP
jgi:hypothetical protein